MCTKPFPNNRCREVYQRHGEIVTNYLSNNVIPALHAKTGHSGTVFLTELRFRWLNHQIMNKWHEMIFFYLEKYFIKHQTLPTLSEVSLKCFRDQIYENFKRHATKAILQMITSERDGEVIDKSLVKDIIQIFESMDTGSLSLYATDFEEPLLSSTRTYYARKRDCWNSYGSTQDYMLNTETILEAERKRVAEYLLPSTEEKLLQVYR
jgi:cullin 1